MEIDIEEIESQLEETVDIAPIPQKVEQQTLSSDSSPQIEEIESLDFREASPKCSRESTRDSSSVSSEASSSTNADKLHLIINSDYADQRKAKVNTKFVFMDLPKRLRDAESRHQSTKSMLSSLENSSLYSSKRLCVLITALHASCGSFYAEGHDEKELYLVHLPRNLDKSKLPKVGNTLLVQGPYVRRRLQNRWLLSAVVTVSCV